MPKEKKPDGKTEETSPILESRDKSPYSIIIITVPIAVTTVRKSCNGLSFTSARTMSVWNMAVTYDVTVYPSSRYLWLPTPVHRIGNG